MSDTSMTKLEAMQWLQSLGEAPAPQVALALTPIAYSHTGSAYSEDTIRFTARTLDRLADMMRPYVNALLAMETDKTRLAIVVQPSVDRDTKQVTGAWACYVSCHMRAPRVIAHGSATKRYARASVTL